MIVDFHSHILPKMDDGSSSTRESLKMLRMEARQGIRHVVVTPHFYAQEDTPERFLKRRNGSEFALRKAMAKYEGMPKLSVGAEVHYFSGMSESEVLLELKIQNTNHILIEMPGAPWTEQMYDELYRIHRNWGLTPIIAHVDRYIGPFHTYRIPERLEELPVLVQANASFFQHRMTRGMAIRMLKGERIHLLGSDCHNLGDRRPNLGQAVVQIEQSLGTGAIHRINAYESSVLQI